MKRLLIGSLFLISTMPYVARGGEINNSIKPKENPFYVYQDRGSHLNHGIPSGFMGAYKSLKYSQVNSNPKEGTTCIHVTYDISKDSETAWAGIYYFNIADNWGTKRMGYDLTGFKKLTFWARGSGFIEKFGCGGIASATEMGDSDERIIGPIDLTDKWQQYTIDLKDADLSHIIGLFYWATPAEYNKANVELFLDEIKFEK